jgi:peptidoglycan/xylan/chitin deacetylase (PgdA/CDA1 family)
MPRRNSGYPRTSYGGAHARTPTTSRGGVPRRVLLAAAGLVGGAGIVEWLRAGHHDSPTVRSGNSGPLPRRTGGAGSHGPQAPSGQRAGSDVPKHPGPHHGHGDSPGPHHQNTPLHGHHHAHGHGNTHGHGHDHHGKGAHHHLTAKERARIRRREHVDLPPAKVRERSHPIYSVAQVDPHPPRRAIALTIDDGPDPEWTPKVLRLLDKHRMQASFCVVGIHADSYPNLIRDIHRAGHVIVNHSYTHVQPFAKQTERRIVEEITRTQRAIERATRVSPELFRSPGGDWSHFVFRAVAAYGLTPLDWDIDPEDWAMPGRKKIQQRMLRGRPGDIVLCHDGGGDRIETIRALRRVLPAWKRRGYTTIPLVLPASAKRPPRRPQSHSTTSPSPSSGPSGSGTPNP